ncbi:MAG: hypothetical protein ABI707_18830 [Ferruginibacter sp.]
MKKLTMVFLATASISFVSAQKVYKNAFPDNKNSAVYAVYQGKLTQYNTAGYNAYEFNAKEKDAKIRHIKQEYEGKISDVKKNRHLRSSEKQQQISWLKKQRDEQIQKVTDRFYANTHGHSDNHNTKKW